MPSFNPACITFSQMNLIFNARIYYRRLTTWTRAYLLSRYFNVGTAEAQFERLYLETLAIGNILQLVFGRRNAEEYSLLLSRYAIIFHQLLDAQLSGDKSAVDENVRLLYENVDERALFLESINPYWSAEEYKGLFYSYIGHILETANAIASGDFKRDIELYDLLNELTQEMGDTFAEGIYAYLTSGRLPDSSRPDGIKCITFEELNDIYTIMMIWFELVIWVRNYMLQRYAGIGSEEEALERLTRVPINYVATLKKYFPDFDSNTYLNLFYIYISLVSDFISAMMSEDVEKLDRATRDLYRNADERASFLSAISPLWSEEELRDSLYVNLRSTIEESNSFLAKDYVTNIDIFTRLLDQAEMMSTTLSAALFDHITQK